MTELTLEELAELESGLTGLPGAPWREGACKHHDVSDARDDGLNCYGVWQGDMRIDSERLVRFTVAARNQLPALLAVARELIRLRSALEYLVRVEGSTVITDDGTDYDLSPEQLQEYAASLGWTDPCPPATPVAELKGGEG